MSTVVSNRAETLSVTGPVKVTGVTLTNESGGPLGLSLYRYQDTGGTRFLRVVSADDETVQPVFNGIAFPDGFTVVPDANLTFFLVEYDPITPASA